MKLVEHCTLVTKKSVVTSMVSILQRNHVDIDSNRFWSGGPKRNISWPSLIIKVKLF